MSARVVVVLAVMFWAPGWAILLLTGAWRALAPLSRWAVALACSVAFYPPLFYLARLLRLPLHAPALILVLACALVIIVGYVWRTGAAHHLPFDRLEWTAIAILALSLIHISEPTRLLSISYAVFCL